MLLNNQKPRRQRRGFWEKEKGDRLLRALRFLVAQRLDQTPRLDFGRSPADRLAAVLDRVVARLAVEDDLIIRAFRNDDFARRAWGWG